MKKFILIAVFLLFASTALGAEIFILYEKSTGYIITTGRIDREWDSKNRDGSTITEYIERKLSEGLAVLYFPEQKLPNPKKDKVADGKIVELTKQEKEAIEAAKPKSELDRLKERLLILEEKVK